MQVRLTQALSAAFLLQGVTAVAQSLPPASSAASLQGGGATSRSTPRYPWKTDIVATIFWVGELPTENNPVPNTSSSWDPRWLSSFGGYDDPDPDNRATRFHPSGFLPRQNPFYVALPYNDLTKGGRKEEAARVIPWFQESGAKKGSVCHNRWIAIHYRGRVCFAQWSDCGPFKTNDAPYVFGSARPSNTRNAGAGLDLSPAVRDYLQFASGEKCDWRFVDQDEVGEGPWKYFGENNPFASAYGTRQMIPFEAEFSVSALRPVSKSEKKSSAAPTRASVPARSRLDALKKAREQWFDGK